MIGRHPLATAKAEPDRKEMAEKGAEAGEDRRRLAPLGGKQHGGSSLGGIEQERRRRQRL